MLEGVFEVVKGCYRRLAKRGDRLSVGRLRLMKEAGGAWARKRRLHAP